MTKSTGAPAVRFSPGNVPPNIFAFAPLKATTVIVRLGPAGAWMVTGISCPLVGFETGTVVVAGEGMPGPVIWTWIEAMSVTDCCAQAGVVPGNQRSIHENSLDGAERCCACRPSTTRDKLTATVLLSELSEAHAASTATSTIFHTKGRLGLLCSIRIAPPWITFISPSLRQPNRQIDR